MDPDAALARLRELCALDNVDLFAPEVADLFEGLDRWLSKGGFPPEAWLRPINAALGRPEAALNPNPDEEFPLPPPITVKPTGDIL